MGWFGFKKKEPDTAELQRQAATKRAEASFDGYAYRHIATYDFNGETSLGDAGPIIDYRLAYNDLRLRSWQAMLESDTAQIGVNRLITWVIGDELKPQCEPISEVLRSESVDLDKQKFSKAVEASFTLFKRSKESDYAGMLSLNEIAEEAEKNALVGGDVLVILRVVDKSVKVQLIDGAHVQSPLYGSEDFPKTLADGNRIIDGVELDKRGQHVAYYVRVSALNGGSPVESFRFQRIPARGEKSGTLMAYLYYGSKHRLNNVRGIPLVSSVIEKIKMVDQYGAAALKQAKNAAEVTLQIVHDVNAEGTNPMTKQIVGGYDLDRGKDLGQTDDGTQIATKIEVTTGNRSFNMPPGAKAETLDNKNPLYFKEFYEVHIDAVFAVLGIPPNVAMSKYNDSFSASRAAIKDWEHTLHVKRRHHQIGFFQPIYNLWLELEILLNKISAPGYILARSQKNFRVIEAYRNMRLIGPQVPHIDPVKEVEAARLKLGTAMAHLPLSDLEKETEMLGCGDADQNIEQAAAEIKSAESKGIKNPQIQQQPEEKKAKDD